MKSRNIIIFVLILAIVGASSFVAINGLKIGDYEITKAKDAVELGLELAGGVYVVLEAQTDAKGEELAKLMNQTKAIINERVDGLGISEPNIAIEGEKRIRVELAGIDDPREAIDLIGKTAQLQFVEPNGNIVLTGKNVVKSEVGFQPNHLGAEVPVVTLEFDNEGASRFSETTGRLTLETEREDRIVFIVLDDQIISAPAIANVAEGGKAIKDGKAVIEGGFDLEGANQLATLIRAGALPVELTELTSSVIGPTLGLEAYNTSIKALGIALLLIFAFVIVVYKLPGFIASLGLIIYTLAVVLIMIVLGVKLSLPGIAGLVLSIGMAVDANVLIFERIREEMLLGKSIRVSVDAGFNRALTSVIDSNVTTLIAGVVLYYFGIGPIKGFGVTLIIGIAVSMVTAVFLTKYLLKLMLPITGNKNTKLYGM